MQCWNLDPHSRPLAFDVTRMLRRTALTFPTIIVKRIAHFVDIMWSDNSLRSLLTWQERCQCLRHLCLVSRAWRECATPFLYRDLRLVLKDGWPLSALIYGLDSSTTKSPFSSQELAGYGGCTRIICLTIVPDDMRPSDKAVGIRNLTERLPGLRLVHILPYRNFHRIVELPSLTTLTLEGVDIAILFDHRPTLQALESIQRLSIEYCNDSALSSRSLREPLPRVYLPNLLEISFSENYTAANIEPFATISTWTMPRLRSLDFRDSRTSPTSLLLDFFKLLSTHGPQLWSLTLKSTHLQEQDISTLLALCSGLHSLDINSPVSLSILSASHARLERIGLHYNLPLMIDNPMDVAADASKSLRIKAQVSFPKLIEAECIVTTSNVYWYGFLDAAASFRAGDTFITLRDGGGKTYRLFDGQAGLVGACFGQVFDCADFVTFGFP
jgi:hypothetical protein